MKMEPFVTRIGDVTIERVVPRSGKEQKESIPAPSVSLAKRGPGGSETETISDTISVSEDLQIFLKPSVVDKEGVQKTSEHAQDREDNGDSCEATKNLTDVTKMVTDEEGCGDGDDESEMETAKEGDVKKTDSELNAKTNNVDDIPEIEAEDTAEDKDSDSQGPSSVETLDCNSKKGSVKDDVDSTDNISEKTQSNKRKASIENCGSGGSQKRKKKKKRRKTKNTDKDSQTDDSGDHSLSSSSDSEDCDGEHSKPSVERKVSNLRRNIREVMNESQLDEETLAAQRQEMERLRRVQEQQRIIREVQRQIALNRQNSKTQTRVISLLQGNSSILKQLPGTSSSSASSGSNQVRLPNTVLVKLASGSGSGSNTSTQTKKVYELLRVQKGSTGRGASHGSRSLRSAGGRARGVPPVHMMTPSVSIAPVMPAHSSQQGSESESDMEECSDKEVSSSGGLKSIGKLKAKGDVVTISSSSDDDDCILLSEPSSGDEADPVDDPTNSGMHTNDLYNVPDDQGRVLVNVGHPPEEPDIFLAPQIARIIKPHQN